MALLFAGASYRQRNLPSAAATPTTVLAVSCTYCFWPAASIAITEEYAAPPPGPRPKPPRRGAGFSAARAPSPAAGNLLCQIVSPVDLLRATSNASGPPGVQISLS